MKYSFRVLLWTLYLLTRHKNTMGEFSYCFICAFTHDSINKAGTKLIKRLRLGLENPLDPITQAPLQRSVGAIMFSN